MSSTTKTYFWVSRNTSDEVKNGKTDTKVFRAKPTTK